MNSCLRESLVWKTGTVLSRTDADHPIDLSYRNGNTASSSARFLLGGR
jgi:hypothetical protein